MNRHLFCRHGGTFKSLSLLLRHKLVHHENIKYDSYRLTYLGYDYLCLNTFVKRCLISSVGRQIGVGKESDIFEVLLTALRQTQHVKHTVSACLCRQPFLQCD